jgi:hypothetical protein
LSEPEGRKHLINFETNISAGRFNNRIRIHPSRTAEDFDSVIA